MEKISPTSTDVFTLGSSSRITAPQNNVECFQNMLAGLTKTLKSGTTSMEPTEPKESAFGLGEEGVSLLGRTALSLSRVEFGAQRLQTTIKRHIEGMGKSDSLDGNLVQNIVQQQYASATYFIGINKVGSAAEHASEEVTTITRGSK